MPNTVDRLLLLALCVTQLVTGPVDAMTVAAVLAAVTVSALNGYLASRQFRAVSIGSYLAASAACPSLCLCLPLVYYDAFEGLSVWSAVAAAGALGACFTRLAVAPATTVAALIAVSWALRVRSEAARLRQVELRELRDSTQELTTLLTQKNKELLQRQDDEIRLATLKERGRIAREIHDHVGHLLSRSILQVGALMVTQKDDETRTSLSVIRDTLSQAMDSIRSSVHDLYDESFDLRTQVEELVRGFSFCEIHLNYRLESEPYREAAYCFIAIIKEGLNNIIRHSDATLVTLALLEHPAFYQLVLRDNGTGLSSRPGRGERFDAEAAGAGAASRFGPAPEASEAGERSAFGAGAVSDEGVATIDHGLGLRSMEDRVTALGGQFLVEHRGGFRLFVSVPKRRSAPQRGAAP
ncbi:MAG: histidine kinase [Firmicutes bacterium]|jgi:signal transduction histidine kinase|nr:histidine kinase [Bacillota bacterium]